MIIIFINCKWVVIRWQVLKFWESGYVRMLKRFLQEGKRKIGHYNKPEKNVTP
jgi:hypothetical protein